MIAACTGVAAAAAPAADDPQRSTAALDARASGSIPALFGEVRAVLLDLPRFGDWFPALGEWRVLETNPDGVRIYGRQALPWPAQDRDYIVDYRWRDEPDGTFILSADARADGAPPPVGVVRLDVLHSEWRLRADGEATHAEYRVELLPRGGVPRWIEAPGWRRHTGVLIRELAHEVERRRSRGSNRP